MEGEEEDVFAVIGNIPPDYHSVDLRNYFSMFIESGGFTCFHFRHRPEVRRSENEAQSKPEVRDTKLGGKQVSDVLSTLSSWGSVPVKVSKPPEKKVEETPAERRRVKGTTCCVVKVKGARVGDLLRMYHRKHWLDRSGDSIPSLCQVTRVNVRAMSAQNDQTNKYKTRAEQKSIPPDREDFTASDLERLPELHPPDIMPRGNVGTPTAVFLGLIQECRLPPQVIAKLGLKFPRTRTNKMYSKVHFDYGGEVGECPTPEPETVTTAEGHELEKEGQRLELSGDTPKDHKSEENEQGEGKGKKGTGRKRRQKRRSPSSSSSEEEEKKQSDSDSDDCEDYERHEALHSDVAHHVERNKERLFESEIELKWEKGGSGLVFYTDAQYWDQQKGDFDERTADDWDVDMEIYTDPRAGDKDARDHLAMRQETRRRAGREATDMYTAGVGRFEKHTKGIGRRVMEAQGWADGQGLGGSIRGSTDIIDSEGQKPFDRSGLGYLGEKLDRSGATRAKRARRQDDVIISTVYDDPDVTDPAEALYRTNDHHLLSWRRDFRYGGTQGGT